MRSDQIIRIKPFCFGHFVPMPAVLFKLETNRGGFREYGGCLCLGTRAGSGAQLLIPSRTRQHGIAEMKGLSAVSMRLMLGTRRQTTFTGRSVSSNAVSGSSTGATARAQTNPSRSKRTNMHRTQIKATHPNCHARYSCWHSMSTKILSVVNIHQTILSIFAQLQQLLTSQ